MELQQPQTAELIYLEAFAAGLRPDPLVSVAEWADMLPEGLLRLRPALSPA